MFKNYIKIAWRNIIKNKGIFSINIFGLAIGIASYHYFLENKMLIPNGSEKVLGNGLV